MLVEELSPALGVTLGLCRGQAVDGLQLAKGFACSGWELPVLGDERPAMCKQLLVGQDLRRAVVSVNGLLLGKRDRREELREALPDHMEETVPVWKVNLPLVHVARGP